MAESKLTPTTLAATASLMFAAGAAHADDYGRGYEAGLAMANALLASTCVQPDGGIVNMFALVAPQIRVTVGEAPRSPLPDITGCTFLFVNAGQNFQRDLGGLRAADAIQLRPDFESREDSSGVIAYQFMHPRP